MPLSPDAPDPTVASPGRRRRRAVAGSLAVVALAGGGIAAQQVASADAAATERERASASTELRQEIATVRTALADPARDGHVAASALARHQLAALAGGDEDPELTDRLVGELREAADELEEASRTPLPDRPDVLSVSAVDPVFERLDGLEQQAARLAERLHAVADEAETFETSRTALNTAAAAYADGAASASGSTPDEVAASWRDERERLDDYAAAINEAREVPALAPLANAHALLVDGMYVLTDDALADLDQGDLDGHNARLEDTLAGDDPFGVAEALGDAKAQLADRWASGPLQQARGEALGLLTELEHLRRATPPAAWSG